MNPSRRFAHVLTVTIALAYVPVTAVADGKVTGAWRRSTIVSPPKDASNAIKKPSTPTAPTAMPVALIEAQSPSLSQSSPEIEVSVRAESDSGEYEGSSSDGQRVQLDDVIESVYGSYPLFEIAVLERIVATGRQTEAAGAFDTQLKADTMTEPLGFYQNYRGRAGFQQPLWSGGYFEGAYRIGVGSFEPWYGERQTDDGGEFSAALAMPLVRDRRIDERRTKLLQSRVDRSAVEPAIQSEFIEFVRQASIAYWIWIASGEVVEANQRLLELAEDRQNAIELQIAEGEEAPIDAQDNRRLIASRRAKLIHSKQKLRESAIKLSLFLRDVEGRPRIAKPENRLEDFPAAEGRDPNATESDIELALSNRPELISLNLDRNRLNLELAQANNTYLPRVDAYVGVSDDFGGWASTSGNKSPSEMEAGLAMSVPLQRRTASGKIQATRAKLSQLIQKIRYTQDKITTEVQAAINDMVGAYDRLGFAHEGVQLAEVMSQAEREKFQQGESNLLDVNLREDQAVNARIAEIEAQLDYFMSQSNLRAAQGLDANRAAIGATR